MFFKGLYGLYLDTVDKHNNVDCRSILSYSIDMFLILCIFWTSENILSAGKQFEQNRFWGQPFFEELNNHILEKFDFSKISKIFWEVRLVINILYDKYNRSRLNRSG